MRGLSCIGWVVALAADDRGGHFTTPPIVMGGDELQVNVDAADTGEVRVEILGRDGKPIDGFSAAQADPIRTDATAHTVSWEGRTDLSALRRTPISIRMALRSAKLYAFQFIERP